MQIEKLQEIWISEDVATSVPVTDQEIISFQSKNAVILPKDLIKYFKLINGNNEEYDTHCFQFYSLKQFNSIDEELKTWNGVPDYSGIVETLKDYKRYFVFADYCFHMFSYAIHLNNVDLEENEVLVICGNEYKKIANSFSQFIELYLSNSIELQLNN